MNGTPLIERISGHSLPPSPQASSAIDRLLKSAKTNSYEIELKEILEFEGVLDFLGSALGDSPYLLACADRDLADLDAILNHDPVQWVARQMRDVAMMKADSRQHLMAALRIAKRRLALGLGLADLAGAASLEFVTGSLSEFADAALDASLAFALGDAAARGRWLGGGLDNCGLAIIAMGKHGAYELNYSSDIDIITFFEPAAPGLADGEEPSTFWVRIVREIVALMQERTADGYVFRTDLRLRPDPGATAVAISVPGALQYYESMGQNWERAAMIKARAAAGDKGCGHQFLTEIRPFIWRKHLDFAAIADIHSIKRQIHAHRGHGTVQVAGHDIKRGRGGIREIELFVQTQQLIAGGRDPDLRARQTRGMLRRLNEREWIGTRERNELDEAYEFLRQLEHRLQMVRDEQTHTIPKDEEERARIARLCGYPDIGAFESALRERLERVAAHYSQLFEAESPLSAEGGNLVFTGDDDDPDTLKTLESIGYTDPQAVTRAVRAWHFGRYPATRSTFARQNLTEFTPDLLRALAGEGDPDAAFRAFDELVKNLPAGVQFFALLASNRAILGSIALMMGAAPSLAENLARHPHVIDALIEPALLSETPDQARYRETFEAALDLADSYEDALDRARRFASEQKFLISVRLLSGASDPKTAASAYSDLAEAVAAGLFGRVHGEFARRHGAIPGGRTALLAFGRLGSCEMTAGSDLDLIVIYDHDANAKQSDGAKPLMASQYFTRLTQRFVAALSAPTAEGVAYEVDLRMRPSGRSGPLATHIDAFTRYQYDDAWTWEHMALCRARVVAGDAEVKARIIETIETVLERSRPAGPLRQDIWDMRQKVTSARPPRNCWDIKLASGGLMDLEFLAQFLILSGYPRKVGEPVHDTYSRMIGLGAVDAARGAILVRSSRLQSALFQTLRAVTSGDLDPESATPGLVTLLERAARRELTGDADYDQIVMSPSGAGKPDCSTVMAWLDGTLAATQEATRTCFEDLLEPGNEECSPSDPTDG